MSEIEKVNQDVALYGRGYMIDGKRVNPESIVIYDAPVQTEADKKRDEQIEAITNALYAVANRNNETLQDDAVTLYAKGVRVIAPDEYVVKRLTDEQKDRLCDILSFPAGHKFVDAVQRELGITP